jgi:hypothetical protein
MTIKLNQVTEPSGRVIYEIESSNRGNGPVQLTPGSRHAMGGTYANISQETPVVTNVDTVNVVKYFEGKYGRNWNFENVHQEWLTTQPIPG